MGDTAKRQPGSLRWSLRAGAGSENGTAESSPDSMLTRSAAVRAGGAKEGRGKSYAVSRITGASVILTSFPFLDEWSEPDIHRGR